MSKPVAYLEPKRHYEILDGLRGVAAIIVVSFHILEASNGGSRFNQIINHGYLAVDFFFLLSGFVVAYAYDDRWGKMTQWDFYKRRLVRLQPMVIMGSVIGAALFYFQGGALFPLIDQTPVWKTLLVMLVGCTLLPLPVSMDIRGWQEMHPLNGPAWSLFFEYVANILYALIVRRFSKGLLAVLVFLSGCLMIHYLLTGPQGDLIGGWSITGTQLGIGFTRLLYPFFGGVLLCRMGKLIHVNGAFWVCTVLIATVLALPRFGDADHLWMNGFYEAFAVIVMFPLIVAIGAGGHIKNKNSVKICSFLGAISYPIYTTHYPLIYIYTAWVVDKKIPIQQALPYGALVLITAILLAYTCLKLYDEPVREWLKNKFLVKRSIS